MDDSRAGRYDADPTGAIHIVPVERWDTDAATDLRHPLGAWEAPSGVRWHLSNIALTTADAEPEEERS